MSEDHIELSQDQIKLVEAFEAAASYFAARIVNEAEIDLDIETETVEEIVNSRGVEQANSKISEEAMRRFSDVIEDYPEYPEYYEPVVLNWLKLGGMSGQDTYFLGDAIGASDPTQREDIKEACRQSVMRNVLFSTGADPLPDDNRRELLRKNGAYMPKP